MLEISQAPIIIKSFCCCNSPSTQLSGFAFGPRGAGQRGTESKISKSNYLSNICNGAIFNRDKRLGY